MWTLLTKCQSAIIALCGWWIMGPGAWSHGKNASIWWLCKSEWCLNAGAVGLFLWLMFEELSIGWVFKAFSVWKSFWKCLCLSCFQRWLCRISSWFQVIFIRMLTKFSPILDEISSLCSSENFLMFFLKHYYEFFQGYL